MITFQTLTIRDGETIQILVTRGINNQRCLIQISLVLLVFFFTNIFTSLSASTSSTDAGPSLEDIVKTLASNTL